MITFLKLLSYYGKKFFLLQKIQSKPLRLDAKGKMMTPSNSKSFEDPGFCIFPWK